MTSRNVEITLHVEVDEDRVKGSAAMNGGAPQPFTGWIGLVGVIEELACGDGHQSTAAGESPRVGEALRPTG